jgi:hypothetical protein
MSQSESQKTSQSTHDSKQEQAGPKYISRREAIKLLAVSTGALTMVAMTFPKNVTLPPKWMDPTVTMASPTAHAIASVLDATSQAETETASTSTETPTDTPNMNDTPTPFGTLPATQTLPPTITDTSTATSTKTPVPYVPPTDTATSKPKSKPKPTCPPGKVC